MTIVSRGIILLLVICFIVNLVHNSPISREVVLNITRLEGGDDFFISGGECGVTRCNEISGGTALSSRPPGSGTPCGCRCRPEVPLFREDLLHCVDDIAECPLADFGSGETVSKVPFVFMPLNGQIVHPSKEIFFEDSSNAICAVSNAQYLTKTGWNNFKNDVDSDVPLNLFRDEGKTYLQWRGTENTRSKATGRVILTKLSCRSGKRIFSPCIAFRVSGSPPDTHDVTEVYFSHGGLLADNVNFTDDEDNGQMGKAAGAIIVLSTFAVIILYGILLFIHIRNRNKRSEAGDTEIPHFEEESMTNTKTNPLLSIETFLKESQESPFDSFNDRSDASDSSNSSDKNSSEKTEDSAMTNERPNLGESVCSLITNATIHQEKNIRDNHNLSYMQNIGNSEKIPELHISIVETAESCCQTSYYDYESEDSHFNILPVGSQRKKLYFNPSFFEIEYLKSPPPAAIEFLTKIREVIAIAKNKMLSKRFVPVLSAIQEEEYPSNSSESVDFPYESLSKNHSSYSLKHEGRRKKHCSGCPGCTEMKFKKKYLKTFSEKEFCKDCITNEFKQDIVKKWLEEVPVVALSSNVDTLNHYCRSISRVEGTPASINPDSIKSQDKISINVIRMPIPPPPPPEEDASKSAKVKEEVLIPKELKEKMNAVIDELTRFRKIEPILPRASSPITEVVTPFIPKSVIAVTPKLVIPTPPRYAKQIKPKIMSSENLSNIIGRKQKDLVHYEIDSLERSTAKRRASLSDIDYFGIRTEDNDTAKIRSSIIAMEELEPMKKIQEMNSRLSRSFQEMSAASLAWDDTFHKFSEEETHFKRNNSFISIRSDLVSEVYISDSNHSSNNSESSKLNVQYVEPVARPGQLIIEVKDMPRKQKDPDYEDFDPDTLDRKPGKLNILPKTPPHKNIDKLFDRSNEVNCKSEETKDSIKLKVGTLLEIFEAKNRRNSVINNSLTQQPDVLSSLQEEFKPHLISKSPECVEKAEPEIYRIGSFIKFRSTRSDPYPNKDLRFSSGNEQIKYTTFGSMGLVGDDAEKQYSSLDPSYENFTPDPKHKKTNQTDDRVKTGRNEQVISLKRTNRRSSKHRQRRLEQIRVHKTEDSGYLSSDSNESRHRGKFILQVRDKDNTKEIVSDTDDLDSMGDGHSESGGESIETNSVFFGSYRRVSLPNKNRIGDLDHTEDSGFHGEVSTGDDGRCRAKLKTNPYRNKSSSCEDL